MERDEKGRFVKGMTPHNKGKPIKEWISEEIRKERTRKISEAHSRPISEDKLYELYHNKELSTTEIGEIFGNSSTHVLKYMKKYGIERRKQHACKYGGYDFPKGEENPNFGRLKGEDNPMYGKYQSKETRDNIGKANKKKWEDIEYKKRTLKAQIESRKLKPSIPEKKVKKLLDNIHPNEFAYNGDFSLGITIGGRIPDFVNVNGNKEVIEVFGQYWHSPLHNPNVNINRTYENTVRHYKKYGWNCLIIWDYELNNKDNVIQKIQNFMEG
ncbi:MAG: NUMOD3 domain-containing DNA-binding protein [bacterium]